MAYIYPPGRRCGGDGHVRFASKSAGVEHDLDLGYHIREAGSTALQELAFTLDDGMEYVEWAVHAGLEVDEFAPR